MNVTAGYGTPITALLFQNVLGLLTFSSPPNLPPLASTRVEKLRDLLDTIRERPAFECFLRGDTCRLRSLLMRFMFRWSTQPVVRDYDCDTAKGFDLLKFAVECTAVVCCYAHQ